MVKHAHHKFEVDQPGKDSWRHREAGAFEVLVASNQRLVLQRQYEKQAEPQVHELLAQVYEGVDWVLVEGFKRDAFPKLEIHRKENGKPLLHPDDPRIVAIAADVALPQAQVPVIDLDDIEAICDLLLKHAIPVEKATAGMGAA